MSIDPNGALPEAADTFRAIEAHVRRHGDHTRGDRFRNLAVACEHTIVGLHALGGRL